MFDDLEISPGSLILAVIAFGIGLVVSKSMGAGIFYRFIVAAVCGVAGFIVASIMANR